jgi:hypothetical protein
MRAKNKITKETPKMRNAPQHPDARSFRFSPLENSAMIKNVKYDNHIMYANH